MDELGDRGAIYIPHLMHDFAVALVAACCAVLSATAFAILILSNRFAGNAMVAAAAITQALPMVALAPLLIIVLGHGLAVKILIAWLVCFFPVLSSVVDSTAGLRSGRDWSGASLRSSVLGRFWWVSTPCIVDGVAAGMKATFALSVIGAIIADFAVSDWGLGRLINGARVSYDLTTMYTAVILAGALGIGMWALGGLSAFGARRLVRSISR